jgi:hypothetical protein
MLPNAVGATDASGSRCLPGGVPHEHARFAGESDLHAAGMVDELHLIGIPIVRTKLLA